jgi:ABC-type sugar transport system substrate-binding protein
MQGEWSAANLPQNTNICYLQGTSGREASILREEGFRKSIASRGDLKVISAQSGNFERARGMQITEDWIQAYGDSIGCIVSADNQMIIGSIEALKAANMINQVTVVGLVSDGSWDGDPIRTGEENYAVYVYWPEIGNLCADIAADVYAGNAIPERSHIQLQGITPQNYAQFIGN